MIQFLYGLFGLGVVALVVSCCAYLLVTRKQGGAVRSSDGESAPASRAAAKKAEEIGGLYRLSDLEGIFERLGVIEAWGMILELKFTTVREDIQMVVDRNKVELCAPSLEPGDTDLFRRAAREVGLQARAGYTEGQYCVDVTGTWSTIASAIRGISRSIYGVGDSEEVHVRVFS